MPPLPPDIVNAVRRASAGITSVIIYPGWYRLVDWMTTFPESLNHAIQLAHIYWNAESDIYAPSPVSIDYLGPGRPNLTRPMVEVRMNFARGAIQNGTLYERWHWRPWPSAPQRHTSWRPFGPDMPAEEGMTLDPATVRVVRHSGWVYRGAYNFIRVQGLADFDVPFLREECRLSIEVPPLPPTLTGRGRRPATGAAANLTPSDPNVAAEEGA